MNIENIDVKEHINIVFMGTPEFSVPILEGLIANYHVRGIVTQPDKAVGRKQEVKKTPVKLVGEKHTILVIQPEKIREDYGEVLALKPDLIITCAYGQILPKKVLEIARINNINVHASLLPNLRGGAPIQRAIIEGFETTGISIMQMIEKMDAGVVYAQETLKIDNDINNTDLFKKLSVVGADLLIKTLPSIINGTNSRTKQDSSQATYAFTLKKEDEKINFNKTARQIHNQIRGLNSWPGAYCIFEGKILKVWDSFITDNYPIGFNGQITAIYKEGIGVKVSNGEVVFKIVQPEGKNKMDAISFVNGLRDKNIVGKVLE